VDYLSSLCHDEECRYSERQLRQILSLPTEKEQVEAFEELRQRLAACPHMGGASEGD